MRWIITDPRGVEEALSDPRPERGILPEAASHFPVLWLSRITEPGDSCLAMISDLPALSPKRRLGIYAEAYFSRLRDCLADDFSKLAREMGSEDFHALIADYLVEHPSTYRCVGEVGRSLPEFLSGHPLAKRYPFGPELAALEWAVVESFLADDMPVFDPSSLSSLAEEEWATIRFTLDSSVRLLTAYYPVGDIWISDASDRTMISGDRSVSPVFLLVYRRHHGVLVETIGAIPFLILNQMIAGSSLGEIAEDLPARDECSGDAAAVMEAFSTLFGQWVEAGIIRGIERGDGDPE